ncbi:hypothetical protein D3C80_1907580 [compost metagenome]
MKYSALAYFALSLNRTMVRIHDIFHNRQSKTCTATLSAHTSFIRFVEALKYVRQVIRRNTDSVILNKDMELSTTFAVLQVSGNRDLPLLMRMSQCIIKQVR